MTGGTDLYKQLVTALYAIPHPDRQRHHWVMDRRWYDECAKIGDWPPPSPGARTMLGLPLKIREDGGFPHLVRGYVGTTADATTLERAADILAAFSPKPRSFWTGVFTKVLRDAAAKIRAQQP